MYVCMYVCMYVWPIGGGETERERQVSYAGPSWNNGLHNLDGHPARSLGWARKPRDMATISHAGPLTERLRFGCVRGARTTHEPGKEASRVRTHAHYSYTSKKLYRQRWGASATPEKTWASLHKL